MNAPQVPEKELENGAQLLDDVRAAVVRYCVLPSAETTDAVVLWVAATHCLPAFDYAPRLVVRSAEKRSGKSRLLEVIAVLCHSPLRVVNVSTSFIFRSLDRDEHPPTLLLDEADAIFGTKMKAEQNEDLRGLINAGFQRGLNYGRTEGPSHIPREYKTFAMAATASIGRMPDTIEDRAVILQMRRRKPSETVQPYRRRRDEPPLLELRDRLAVWGSSRLDELGEAIPDLPIEDRAADTWEPLVAVADAAGVDWAERARTAAKLLTAEADEHDSEASLNVRLLGDIRDVFDDNGTKEMMASAVLCEQLRKVEDAPWRDFDLNPSKLGRRLSEYDIRTKHNTAKSARGYRVMDFLDAFERYLPPPKDDRDEDDDGDKASEGVQGVQNTDDQYKQPDTLKTPDTFKASGHPKVSGHNPKSDPIGTGLDGFGHLSGKNTPHGQVRTDWDAAPPDPAIHCPDCQWPLDSEAHETNCERTTP